MSSTKEQYPIQEYKEYNVTPANWRDLLRFAQPMKATRLAGAALATVAHKATNAYDAVANPTYRNTMLGSLLDRSV